MEQQDNFKRSRVNPDTNEGLIIEKVSLLSKLTVYSQWSYNVLAWAVWFFLLRPLIIVFLWYMGVKMTYFQMVKMEGFNNPEFFRWLAVGICFILVIMFAWSRYNAIRFRNKERRHSRGECDSVDMADFYRVEPETIDLLKASGNIAVSFLDAENIEVDCGDGNRFRAVYAPQNPKLHLSSAPMAKSLS